MPVPVPPPPDRPPLVVFTIGHSTRTFEAFATLLRAHGVRQVADIRTVPRSRRNPQFGRETLPGALAAVGIAYRHVPALGGLRHPRADSPNRGWRNDSFRGYADYMSTPAFDAALDEVMGYARVAPTALMCAEAVWWRCHRWLVADALVVRGVEVRHIIASAASSPHELNRLARVDGLRISYPPDARQPGSAAVRLKE
jgi:uncharacterized protein (DUF488 family)